MKHTPKLLVCVIIVAAAFTFSACHKKDAVRKLPDATPPVSAAAPVAKAPIKWDTPKGWSDKGGNSVRLATLVIDASASDAECTIISLQGEGGGLKPNVMRWLNQINCEFDEAKLDDFLAKQSRFTTAGGLPGILVDLTSFSARSAETAISIMVGIVNCNDETIFVKISGKKDILRKYKEPFAALCKSLRLE